MKLNARRLIFFLPYLISFLFGTAFSSCTKKEIILLPGKNAGYRTLVPLQISYLSPTDTRASVIFNIGGTPVNVLFDTGSWGLRVLRGAVKEAPIDTDQESVYQSYTGGVTLYGKVAGANLSIGGLNSATPVKFMRIDSTMTDTGTKPWISTGNAAVIPNSLLGPFNGIVGVGMRYSDTSGGVASPFPQLPGVGSFIVHFPTFNPNAPQIGGELILNPCATDLLGFTYIHLNPGAFLLPNGYNSWLDNQLNGTLTVNGVPYSHNTLLDSGNPFDYYYKDNLSDSVVRKGSIVSLSLQAPVNIDTTFKVINQYSGLDLVAANKNYLRDVFGIQFFFDYDVYYDQKNGIIGVRRKP